MFGLGTTELVVILVIVVILFGGKKLPEIGSGIGKSIRNFKKATKEVEENVDEKSKEIEEEEKKE